MKARVGSIDPADRARLGEPTGVSTGLGRRGRDRTTTTTWAPMVDAAPLLSGQSPPRGKSSTARQRAELIQSP